MTRLILAVLAGVLAGGLAVGVLEMVGYLALPLPEGLVSDPTDIEAVRAAASQIPDINRLAVVMAWAGGALVSGWVAARVAGARGMMPALIAGGVLMFAGAFNLFAIPSPWWMWMLGLGVYLPGAWLGAQLSGRA